MSELRVLSPGQRAAVEKDSRLSAVVEVMLAAASMEPACFPSVTQLAKIMHASRRTLERRFRRELGTSYRSFRQLLRVRHAEARLGSGDAGEKSVARAVGYASPGSLVRAFVRVDRVTPRGKESRSTRRRDGTDPT